MSRVVEMVTPAAAVDLTSAEDAEMDKFWREMGELMAAQPFAEVSTADEVVHPSSSLLKDPRVGRHQTSSSTTEVPPLRLRMPTLAHDPCTRGKTVLPKPIKRRRQTASGRVATTKRQRRVRRDKAQSRGSTSTLSSLTMPLQSSSSNPLELAATIAPSPSSQLPPNQVTPQPQVNLKETPSSTSNLMTYPALVLSIDPIDYVRSTFDTCILPNITAPTPTQHAIRTHIYRKMVIEIAKEESSRKLYLSGDDLCTLASICFSRLGLM